MYMVYGELGRFPLEVFIKSRIVNFWSRLVTNNLTRTSSILYNLLYHLDYNNLFNASWITHIKTILNNCGFSNLWLQQNISLPKANILQRIKDQFIQTWLSDINTSNFCVNYRIFKTSHNFENYLIMLPIADAINLCKFRTSCIKIPVVTGRFNNIDRVDRLCTLCTIDDIGDEYHYVFICDYFKQLRKKIP